MLGILIRSKMQIYNEIYRQTQDWCLDYESHAILLSKTMYNDIGLLLIIASFLLLVTMMGAIVVTLEVNKITRKQNQSSYNLLQS